MPVTDIAFCILKSRGKAMHFKELITEILKIKGLSLENSGRLIAQWHTEINLDSRFLHQGGGEWGLREWLPRPANKVVRIRPESPAPVRPRPILRPEDEEEDHFGPEDEEDYMDEELDEDYDSDRDDYFEDDE